MKKIKVFLFLTLACSLLTACGATSDASSTNQTSSNEDSIQTVTSNNEEKNAADTVQEAEIDNSLINKYTLFSVTSENLKDGKWDDSISNTEKGKNLSPQLSFDEVEGATNYAIYMVDTSMEYFVHLKANGITETNLKQGWADKSEYIGPYPPTGGTHTYEIYVLALKNPVERIRGGLNGPNKKFPSFLEAVDVDDDGNTGNVVGAAHISGTFTN